MAVTRDDQSGTQPFPLAEVAACRLSTDGSSSRAVDEMVQIVREEVLFLEVEGVRSFSLLCTPTDLRALTVGFLLTNEIISDLSDIEAIACCCDPPRVSVTLAGRARSDGTQPFRARSVVSVGGPCDAADPIARIAALPKVGSALLVEPTALRRSLLALRRHQPLFAACGGTHAAGLFDASGELGTVFEDVGRHNALDKAIGGRLLAGYSPVGCGVAISSRVSLELVAKCARAGVEFIGAVSAPTSLAVEAADRVGITLCAFVRAVRATAFTHPGRLLHQ